MPEMPSSESFSNEVRGNADFLDQILLPLRIVEEPEQLLAVFVVDIDDHVGVLYVVNPRHMLIANAFNAVSAETVVEQRRALQRFADGELGVGVVFLEVVAGGHGAGGTGGAHKAAEAGVLAAYQVPHLFDGVAGHVVVPEGVAHLFELVEDHVVGIEAQFGAFVVDLFDVGFATGGGRDDFGGDGFAAI